MRLSLLVVCYGEDVAPMLSELDRQRAPGDEIIVVDNRAAEGGTAGVKGHPAIDRLIEPTWNMHYLHAMNLAAKNASGDALVLLNPDAYPQGGFLDAMRNPPEDWAGWTAVLTLPDGRHINNGGGIVHFTGLAWSGRFGETVDELPDEPFETGFLSGGALAIRRAAWEEMGGYAEVYGGYHEDTELSLRLRLAGHRYGVVPAARTAHDYVFEKGTRKWRNLERNRWLTVLRIYPAPLLVLVLPALLAMELPMLAAAAIGGWGRWKVQSWIDVAAWLPKIPQDRRQIQATRRITPRQFADGLSPELSSPFLGAIGRSRLLQAVLRAYWSAVRALLP